MNKFVLGAIIIILAIAAYFIFSNNTSFTGCTEEAKLCPDGTVWEETGVITANLTHVLKVLTV